MLERMSPIARRRLLIGGLSLAFVAAGRYPIARAVALAAASAAKPIVTVHKTPT
jgi:hypothetical protein